MRARFGLVIGALSTLVLLGACSSGSTSSGTNTDGTANTTGAASSVTLEPIDVCGLISNAQIANAGGSGSGRAFEPPFTEGAQWDICSWGELQMPPVITIHVEQVGPDAPIDPLETMVNALGSSKERTVAPIDVGKDGKLYNVALLTAGGGVGSMIVFRAPKGELVAVSATGTEVNVPALTTLAKQVNAELA